MGERKKYDNVPVNTTKKPKRKKDVFRLSGDVAEDIKVAAQELIISMKWLDTDFSPVMDLVQLVVELGSAQLTLRRYQLWGSSSYWKVLPIYKMSVPLVLQSRTDAFASGTFRGLLSQHQTRSIIDKKPELLVKFLLFILFARQHAIGFDPTVQRIRIGDTMGVECDRRSAGDHCFTGSRDVWLVQEAQLENEMQTQILDALKSPQREELRNQLLTIEKEEVI
ncbi:hypothetical protein EV368DRAFT_70087 [Lentinula lateritia]|nr:hypothetical protein EV368DRAFT_70087 [Lentinula lateritia]